MPRARQFAEIGRGAVDAAERDRRDAGADQHQVGAELLHDIELALGAVEGAAALRLGQALEVAERLEQRDREAGVARHPADVARRAVEGEEVVLENLDAVEARGGDRRELLGKVAAIETVAIEVFTRRSASATINELVRYTSQRMRLVQAARLARRRQLRASRADEADDHLDGVAAAARQLLRGAPKSRPKIFENVARLETLKKQSALTCQCSSTGSRPGAEHAVFHAARIDAGDVVDRRDVEFADRPSSARDTGRDGCSRSSPCG